MYFVHPQLKLGSLEKTDLKSKLASYFPGKQLVFTDMGRSAFKLIIEKLNLQNSEIMMPAYICDIFAPILKQYNIKPIFLDIDLPTFHIKTEGIEKRITPRTKAILVCHTYGLLFDVGKVKNLGLTIIEDCAHAFGARPKSDVAFFSLYKQFPALRGGLLVYPQDWKIEQLPKTNFSFRDFLSLLNCFPLFAFLFKKFGNEIAPKIVRKEKMPNPSGINRVSLKLFSASLGNFETTLNNRIKMALIFQEKLKELGFEVQKSEDNIFCYLSAMVPKNMQEKRDVIVQKLRKYGVFCTRIWRTPIVLDQREFPNAFEAARRIINFPLQNHYTEKDIEKMANAIKKAL